MLEKAYMREVVWRPIVMLPWESSNYDMANDYDQKRTYAYRFNMNGVIGALMLLVDREGFSLYVYRTYYYDTWSNEYFLYSEMLLSFDN